MDLNSKEIVFNTNDEEYKDFINGRIKLQLIGSCSRGYDEADRWEYWCYNGRLFHRPNAGEFKELDKKLIPIIFFNPLFEKILITPYSKIFESWIKLQQSGKFKMRLLRYYSGSPKYMYELKEDHLIRYVREDDGIKEYKMDEIWMFHFFNEFAPSFEDTTIINKEEFMKLGGLRIVS